MDEKHGIDKINTPEQTIMQPEVQFCSNHANQNIDQQHGDNERQNQFDFINPLSEAESEKSRRQQDKQKSHLPGQDFHQPEGHYPDKQNQDDKQCDDFHQRFHASALDRPAETS